MHRRWPIFIAIAIAITAATSAALRRQVPDTEPQKSAATAGLTMAQLESLASAFPEPDDAPLEWPRDHGAKPEQFADAWLFAGLLRDENGRRYGFHLGFWRISLQPETAQRESAWATREFIAASMAIEPEGERGHGGERVSRVALGLAGAARQPARVWLEDWTFALDETGQTFELQAAEGQAGMDLRLSAPEAMPTAVRGIQHRGYWWPGLAVRGTLRMGETSLAVTGQAMLDRLWGRALPAGRGQLALSRLWLELGDGTALRCEQLRRKTGGGTPLGNCLQYGIGDREGISIEPADGGWTTFGNVRYPLRWRLRIASREAVLELQPLPGEPAETFAVRWRGTMVVSDRHDSWGLLELSNFAAP
jgi:predicted secreted hydrolase